MELDVVVIGAGPAGAAAAIQLKRYGLSSILLEKERIGGLLWNANLIENYPGFPAGISGPKLARLVEKQMQRIGVELVSDEVTCVVTDDDVLRVETSQTSFCSRYVIAASGTKPKLLPLDIPQAARDRVFGEIHPLLNEHNKHIVIVGAGDAAFDYALNLVKKRNSVTILNRGREVKCLKLLRNRASTRPTIRYRERIAISRVEVDETANRLRLALSRSTGHYTEQDRDLFASSPTREAEGERIPHEAGNVSEWMAADYLVFAIGREPQVDFLPADLLERGSHRLYLVGDVKNGQLRQAAIAAGEGLRAAMQIYAQLTNSEAETT
jgi:thioredoxin reductase (NADPH)